MDAWLGVCIAFVVTDLALALSALALLAGIRFLRSGAVDALDSSAYAAEPVLNLAFCLRSVPSSSATPPAWSWTPDAGRWPGWH